MLRRTGDQLQVSAPGLHFLTGKPLERLRNGAAVPFDFQLTVAVDNKNNALARALERFVVSYDLWEDRFRVVRVRDSGKSSSHLTATQAETWCLENIILQASQIPADKYIWIRLEVRSGETKSAAAVPPDSGMISLTTLIDIFSRPTRGVQDRWLLETGPVRLVDFQR
jgi:hypothetical protein